MNFRLKCSATGLSAPGNSSSFRDAVLRDCLSKKEGENGMTEFTDHGIGSNLLALNQLVRGGDPTSLARQILEGGTPVDVAHLIIMIFLTRNARGGKGEKKISYEIFLEVLKVMPLTGLQLVRFFPHYGYWKDIFLLMEVVQNEPSLPSATKKDFYKTCDNLLASQLKADIQVMREYEDQSSQAMNTTNMPPPKISLIAKWLPRENSALDRKTGFVSRFSKHFFEQQQSGRDGAWQSATKARYRSTVVKLASQLNLPEVLLAAHREDEINFGAVASKATFRLRKVFLNEDTKGDVRSTDPKRLRMSEDFIDHMVKKGLKGAQVMPHEIVEKILMTTPSKAEEVVLDCQWKSIRESVLAQIQGDEDSFDPTKMVPLSDVSGSMWGTPMAVSIALGILISEITHESFKGLVMTFESTPQWHKLESSWTIVEKVRSLAAAPWGGSTNFRDAYDLILDVAIKNGLAYRDMPSLIVFSDMQIDAASPPVVKDGSTMHNVIEQRFHSVAKLLGWEEHAVTPIVYWNLRNTRGHPVDKDCEGAVLLSGFSPSLLKLVMEGKAMEDVVVEVTQPDGSTKTEKVRVTPEQILQKMLNDDLYNPVKEVIGASDEGKLAQVEVVSEDKPATAPTESEAERDDGFLLMDA